ncbi:hypothetical protein MUP59_00170 [Candidatus Bathyarchaeota archaeon]|nr:hypothetical protein [Candidatus Bathyarchaeota archaeon]
MPKISHLNNKELKAHDDYVTALGQLIDLSEKSLNKVTERLKMLHILNEPEEKILRYQLRRIS